jgi:hypothetical protein
VVDENASLKRFWKEDSERMRELGLASVRSVLCRTDADSWRCGGSVA